MLADISEQILPRHINRTKKNESNKKTEINPDEHIHITLIDDTLIHSNGSRRSNYTFQHARTPIAKSEHTLRRQITVVASDDSSEEN